MGAGLGMKVMAMGCRLANENVDCIKAGRELLCQVTSIAIAAPTEAVASHSQ
jgi:hypothetical protein